MLSFLAHLDFHDLEGVGNMVEGKGPRLKDFEVAQMVHVKQVVVSVEWVDHFEFHEIRLGFTALLLLLFYFLFGLNYLLAFFLFLLQSHIFGLGLLLRHLLLGFSRDWTSYFLRDALFLLALGFQILRIAEVRTRIRRRLFLWRLRTSRRSHLLLFGLVDFLLMLHSSLIQI